jgi:hypothetical protein
MSIADKPENKGKSNGKGFASAHRANQTAEGGNEMILAMTAQVQGQANQMVAAANAANISNTHS